MKQSEVMPRVLPAWSESTRAHLHAIIGATDDDLAGFQLTPTSRTELASRLLRGESGITVTFAHHRDLTTRITLSLAITDTATCSARIIVPHLRQGTGHAWVATMSRRFPVTHFTVQVEQPPDSVVVRTRAAAHHRAARARASA